MNNIVDVVNRIGREIDLSAMKIFFKLSGDYLYEIVEVRPEKIIYEQINVATGKRTQSKPALVHSHHLVVKSWVITPPEFKFKPYITLKASFR